MICRRGVVQSLVPQSSIACFASCSFSSFFSNHRPHFAAGSLVLLLFGSLLRVV